MKRVLMIAAAMLFATAAFAKIEIPKQVKIGAAAMKQPAVTFNHEQHATKLVPKCETCHHTEKGLKATQEKKPVKCTVCHLDPKAMKIGSMRSPSMTVNPMHVRCIGCHKAEKKGPVACAKCHKK